MAARIPTLARLTLFSGPHCSLCDVAKVELSKVKKLREFDLEVISIQDKGQEKWKKKYIYWIPALHLDGKEIAKGRWDASTVLEALKRRDAELDPSPFIIDTSCTLNPLDVSLGHSYLYDKITGVVLGQVVDESIPSSEKDLRRCFNCGSPDHSVASCPEPVDRRLVALSRQLFNFFHPDLVGQEIHRFHIAEGWKQQRLEWLEWYEPGVIRGPLLRDALGLQHEDPGNAVEWLRNMTYWGYPPGWVSHQDPGDLVRSRILADTEDEDGTDADHAFTIFRDSHDDEQVDLNPFSPRRSLHTELDLCSTDHTPTLSASCTSAERKRWAIYPNTLFSSETLSVYSGTPLDGMDLSPVRVSATFTTDRRTLWQRIITGGVGQYNNVSVPPWRFPGAFGGSHDLDGKTYSRVVPPPASITPPPLPPTPTPPLSPARTSRNLAMSVLKRMAPLNGLGSNSIGGMHPADDDGSEDMDVSDDSE
ncbi:hypothetical protein BS17DRAFT_877775 [Gyrodon lividus]|nr:hypothetical protein BS17DRAFT_877775 [Gyrodon lividus]